MLPAEDFATAVAQVAVAASATTDAGHHGCAVRGQREQASLVATDRYRVAIRDIDWDAGNRPPRADRAVPVAQPRRVGKTFGHSGTIAVSIVSSDDRELIAFTADKSTVTSLLIKGNFPPVKRLFPETVDNYAVINTADLIEATRASRSCSSARPRFGSPSPSTA